MNVSHTIETFARGKAFVNFDSGLLLSTRTLLIRRRCFAGIFKNVNVGVRTHMQLRVLYFCFHRSIWLALGHGARDKYDRHNRQTHSSCMSASVSRAFSPFPLQAFSLAAKLASVRPTAPAASL